MLHVGSNHELVVSLATSNGVPTKLAPSNLNPAGSLPPIKFIVACVSPGDEARCCSYSFLGVLLRSISSGFSSPVICHSMPLDNVPKSLLQSAGTCYSTTGQHL